MKSKEEFRYFLEKGYTDYRLGVTVDCAIFGYHEGELKVLLVKDKIVTLWCMPGGFVRKEESLEHAAARTTAERTGIENLFLKQFKTFGNPHRNDSHGAVDFEKLFELSNVTIDKDNWLSNETISVGFYAISDIINTQPSPDIFSTECRWFSINDLPKLAFNHDEMIAEALHAMRIQLYHYPIGRSLLPPKFTLKEIKLFYETMSGKALHASNFPNKLIALGLIEKTDEKRSIGAHRSPTYYKFNEEVYDEALKEGLVLV